MKKLSILLVCTFITSAAMAGVNNPANGIKGGGTVSVPSGTTFAVTGTGTITIVGTDGSTLNIGGGGTLGSAAYLPVGNTSSTVAPGSGSTVYAPLASPHLTGTPLAPSGTAAGQIVALDANGAIQLPTDVGDGASGVHFALGSAMYEDSNYDLVLAPFNNIVATAQINFSLSDSSAIADSYLNDRNGLTSYDWDERAFYLLNGSPAFIYDTAAHVKSSLTPSLFTGTTSQFTDGTGAYQNLTSLNPTMTSNTTGTITFNTTGASQSIYNTSSSTLTTATITLPSTSAAGQLLTYVSNGIITSLTITGGTQDVGPTLPTTLTADTVLQFQEDNTSGHYIRIK